MRSLKLTCAMLLASFALLPAVAHGEGRSSRCGHVYQAPGFSTDHQLRTSILCLVNAARERHGIHPLDFNPALRQSATAHSRSMVRSGLFSHYGPSGSTPTTRVANAGYLARASTYRIAENIGAGEGRTFGSPMAVFQLWMGSSGHRANVLDGGLRDFGVGVARGDPLTGSNGGATYTLVFGARRR